MKFQSDQVVVILASLVLTFGVPSISAEAKARHCTSAECACEQALKRNTAEALEDFLRTVPENELENEHLHRWMRAETIDHYHEHLLPNAPSPLPGSSCATFMERMALTLLPSATRRMTPGCCTAQRTRMRSPCSTV